MGSNLSQLAHVGFQHRSQTTILQTPLMCHMFYSVSWYKHRFISINNNIFYHHRTISVLGKKDGRGKLLESGGPIISMATDV